MVKPLPRPPCAALPQDPRVERLPCTHKGTYADDCICERVKQHRCYIVATCDRDLRRRIRKIAGVPIMFIQSHKCVGVGGRQWCAAGGWRCRRGYACGRLCLLCGRQRRPGDCLCSPEQASVAASQPPPRPPALPPLCRRYSIERLPEATMGGAPRT